MITKAHIRLIECALAVLLIACTSGWGNAQTRFTAGSDSEVVIHGSSTLNTFSCRANKIEAWGAVRAKKIRPMGTASSQDAPVEVHIWIPVASFDCGKQPMNRDMYRALEADAHPTIHFQLDEARLVARPDSLHDTFRLKVNGHLTIAGATRAVSLEAEGHLLQNNRIRVVGQVPLQMTTFGIIPPTALFGLVKARDDITVAFDLITLPGQSVDGPSP